MDVSKKLRTEPGAKCGVGQLVISAVPAHPVQMARPGPSPITVPSFGAGRGEYSIRKRCGCGATLLGADRSFPACGYWFSPCVGSRRPALRLAFRLTGYSRRHDLANAVMAASRVAANLEDAADNFAVRQYIVIFVVPLARRASPCALQDQVRHRPQSSSASRLTAGAFGFFILSQSRECPVQAPQGVAILWPTAHAGPSALMTKNDSKKNAAFRIASTRMACPSIGNTRST